MKSQLVDARARDFAPNLDFFPSITILSQLVAGGREPKKAYIAGDVQHDFGGDLLLYTLDRVAPQG